MTSKMPDEMASMVRSQIEAWTAELDKLRRDPRVRKFTELRQKLEAADAFIEESNAPPLSYRSYPFDPYDAFEFARDLRGREVSTLELSKLAYGRFPEMSNENRRVMIHYLIDNGAMEIARKTEAGHPTWYRVGSPSGEGGNGTSKRAGIPKNELSAFKVDELEDVLKRASRPLGP
jgi:hypothetical protein